MNKVWTDKEIALIRTHGPAIIDSRIASIITQMRGRHVSVEAVRKERQRLGIIKRAGRPKGQR